jgi:hypothetical protein
MPSPLAAIKRKYLGLFFGDTMIPEPSSYIILPLGLYGLESDTPGQFVLRNAT